MPLTVPVLGAIHVRQLTAGDMDAIAQASDRPHRAGRSMARVICDDAGALVFDPDSDADAEFLARLPWKVCKAITEHANRAAGLTEDEAKNG